MTTHTSRAIFLVATLFLFVGLGALPVPAHAPHHAWSSSDRHAHASASADACGDTEDNSSYNDGESVTLATYAVQGNRIINPQLPALDDPILIAHQKDIAKHQYVWALFTKIIPPERRAFVSQFVIFRDASDSTSASVEPDENDPTKWILAVDITLADDSVELTRTLLHESGHLLTLSATQVPPNLATIHSDNPKAFGKTKAACKQYFPGEGCSLPNSYINKFYSRFWRDVEYDWRKMTRDAQDANGFDKFYEKYRDRFVSDYAVTDPEEDIAETWMHFVLDTQPNGKTIADQKVLFFYDYPDLVQLRTHIQLQLKTK